VTFPVHDVTFPIEDVTTTTVQDFFALRNRSVLIRRFGGFSRGPYKEQGRPPRVFAALAGATSGTVKIDSSSPSTRAHSVSGDVRIRGVRGRATVRTVSGECTLSGGEFNSVEIESVSGDVTFTGGVAGQGTFEMQSHSGDINLHLPPTTGADVEMRSTSGDLVIDMGSGRKTGERELDARIGPGGARLRLRSFSGDIKVTQ